MRGSKRDARLGLVGLCLAVSGCGGGGHIAGISGAPTGSAPSYDSFVGLNKNVTLQTTSSTYGYRYQTTNGVVPDTLARDPKGAFGEGGITISYDAASQTYAVHDGANTISYAPADKDAVASASAQTPFDTYTHAVNNLHDTIQAYRVGSANTQFPQLSYTTFVVASRDTIVNQSGVSSATIDARRIYAIGGFETQRSDLPKTGTASYTTYVTGSAFDASARQATGYVAGLPRTISGSATLTADFGAASVSTALALTADGQSIGSFSGVAPIESTTAHFKGDLTAGGTAQGTFAGSFFGPQAAEVGYTFRVQTSIGTADGGVVGKK